ncbi:hypothetical protein C8F04DRAFT_1094543 [Mycena alexandri]|uniref:Indole-diterpene biosynthesis protein PaxU n=1 Tax=Mycena alexandri TaxID=1745969 RepID=A0AAD6T3X5_9AGAR|nr:hypothetical protein C8F04DRAFT_1094543 [Mycena alexandri]
MAAEPFTPLGQHAYIQTPASGAVPSSSTDPTVVLIFGWMSARLSHLHKYTAIYREIYPGATIILVRSHLDMFWTRRSARKARFQPVIEALKALGCLENRQRILTHTFSNGGALHLTAISEMFPSVSVDVPRSASSLIIDSAPGGDTLAKAMLAVLSPIKNVWIARLAQGAFVVLYFLWWLVGHLLRQPSPIRQMMNALRNPRVLPWIDDRTPRLYVYSKMDAMVPWVDIEEHAAQSASQGLDVRRVCFEKSPHVAHARLYPETYWAAVKDVWDDACNA